MTFCQIKACSAVDKASVSAGIVVLVAIICFVGGLLGYSLCQKYSGKSTFYILGLAQMVSYKFSAKMTSELMS